VLELGEQIALSSPAAVRWAKRVVDAATTIALARELEQQSAASCAARRSRARVSAARRSGSRAGRLRRSRLRLRAGPSARLPSLLVAQGM
jgi:hypothetical protein